MTHLGKFTWHWASTNAVALMNIKRQNFEEKGFVKLKKIQFIQFKHLLVWNRLVCKQTVNYRFNNVPSISLIRRFLILKDRPNRRLKMTRLGFKFLLFVVSFSSIQAIDLLHKKPKTLTYSYKTTWYDQKVIRLFI